MRITKNKLIELCKNPKVLFAYIKLKGFTDTKAILIYLEDINPDNFSINYFDETYAENIFDENKLEDSYITNIIENIYITRVVGWTINDNNI